MIYLCIMSRSFYKRYITGYGSEKKDKRLYNRALRKINKKVDLENDLPALKQDVSDVWCLPKDGKSYGIPVLGRTKKERSK